MGLINRFFGGTGGPFVWIRGKKYILPVRKVGEFSLALVGGMKFEDDGFLFLGRICSYNGNGLRSTAKEKAMGSNLHFYFKPWRGNTIAYEVYEDCGSKSD